MKRQEDYLKAICELKSRQGHVRISDIADNLGISRASVTQMIQRLHDEGYVKYKSYSPVELTPLGDKMGREVGERYAILKIFFELLGVSEVVRLKDMHEIEHCLSPESLEKLQDVTEFLQKMDFEKYRKKTKTKKFLGSFFKKK